MPGYPIRTPSDQRSVDSSPRTIAASHVLHRLLMPRHPPCALDNLTNTHIKKSRHKQHRNKRCSRPLYNSQRPHGPPPPPGIHPMTSHDRPCSRQQPRPTPTTGGQTARSSPQDPTVCRQPPGPSRRAGLPGVSTFLEQPPPTPTPRYDTRIQAGTRALHHPPEARRTLACEHPGQDSVR